MLTKLTAQGWNCEQVGVRWEKQFWRKIGWYNFVGADEMTSEFFVLGRRNRFLKKLQAKVLSCTGVLLLVLQEFYTTILITLTSFYLNSSHMKDLYPLFFLPNFVSFSPTKAYWCCPNIPKCVVFYWSVVNLLCYTFRENWNFLSQ